MESERKQNTPLNPPSKEGGRETQLPKAAPFARGNNPHSDENRSAAFTKGDLPNFSAWQMAWELGYTIAIPIVILALVGRWGDRMLGSSPWLLLVGVVLSVFISSFLVYRKIKRIL